MWATRTVRPRTIRSLDYWLGIPACALLTAVRRIMFVKFIEQGATVRAQDALRRARPRVSVFNHRLSPCRNNLCMQTITVDEVFDAARAAVRS